MKTIFPFFININSKYNSLLIKNNHSEYYMRGITYKKYLLNDLINSNISCLIYEDELIKESTIINSNNLLNYIYIFNEENKVNEIISILNKNDDQIINLLKSSMHKNTLFIK